MYIRPFYSTVLFYVLSAMGLFYVHESPILFIMGPFLCKLYESYILCSSDLKEVTHASPMYIRLTRYIIIPGLLWVGFIFSAFQPISRDNPCDIRVPFTYAWSAHYKCQCFRNLLCNHCCCSYALIRSSYGDTIQWIWTCRNQLCLSMLLQTSIFEFLHIAHSSCYKSSTWLCKKSLDINCYMLTYRITGGKLNECMGICNE